MKISSKKELRSMDSNHGTFMTQHGYITQHLKKNQNTAWLRHWCYQIAVNFHKSGGEEILNRVRERKTGNRSNLVLNYINKNLLQLSSHHLFIDLMPLTAINSLSTIPFMGHLNERLMTLSNRTKFDFNGVFSLHKDVLNELVLELGQQLVNTNRFNRKVQMMSIM